MIYIWNRMFFYSLIDVFENFRETCYQYYKLDPAHYYSGSSSSSRCHTGDIDPQWWKMDCFVRWVFSIFLNRWDSSYRVRMSIRSKFHSCGDEMEKPRRPVRSLRKRGTKSWTCAADRSSRLAGTSLIGRQSSAKCSGAWPTRQFLVMTFILNRIRAWIGSR